MSPEFTKELEEKFLEQAEALMNKRHLIVGRKKFRIIESEVYYHDKDNHPDPYSHKNEIQWEDGSWYFNGFGLDYTFGNHSKKIYAGLLIRGIKSIESKPEYISGPSNVLKELFRQINPALTHQTSFYFENLNQEECYTDKLIQSTRIGLSKKAEDKDGFFEKPYRFLVEINADHKFKEKEKLLLKLFFEKKFDLAEVEKILGYKKTSL